MDVGTNGWIRLQIETAEVVFFLVCQHAGEDPFHNQIVTKYHIPTQYRRCLLQNSPLQSLRLVSAARLLRENRCAA